MNEIEIRVAQSPFHFFGKAFSFLNVFSELFARWIHEENAVHHLFRFAIFYSLCSCVLLNVSGCFALRALIMLASCLLCLSVIWCHI